MDVHVCTHMLYFMNNFNSANIDWVPFTTQSVEVLSKNTMVAGRQELCIEIIVRALPLVSVFSIRSDALLGGCCDPDEKHVSAAPSLPT